VAKPEQEQNTETETNLPVLMLTPKLSYSSYSPRYKTNLLQACNLM